MHKAEQPGKRWHLVSSLCVGGKASCRKLLTVRVQSNACSSPHPRMEPGLLSSQRTPRDQTLCKNFCTHSSLAMILVTEESLLNSWTSWEVDSNMMIVCSWLPHHPKGVGESYPTRSHLTRFACLANRNESHWGAKQPLQLWAQRWPSVCSQSQLCTHTSVLITWSALEIMGRWGERN